MAFRILKNANASPRWIELDKEIRIELDEARIQLGKALEMYGNEGDRWDQAVQKFTLRINQLNEFLRSLNLIVPGARFQRRELRPNEEIQRVLTG
jgi:hypothetical protein